MMSRFCRVALCWTLLLAGCGEAPGDGNGTGDSTPPPGPSFTASYVIVSADHLADAAAEFAAFREQWGETTKVFLVSELLPGILNPEILAAAVRSKLAEGRELLPPEQTQFLLLLGDAPDGIPGVPCVGLPDCVTDNAYADLDQDGIPDLPVGRVPAQTLAQARAYLAAVQAFEETHNIGRFNRRLVLYTGQGGFGALIDQLLENLVMRALRELNPAFDVIGTYNKPNSPYYYSPFEQKVTDLFNNGSIMAMYIGHGSTTGAEGLTVAQLADINIQNRFPFAFFYACLNGDYDAAGESLAESALWHPGGPIATVAASDISQPYGNGVLSYETQRAVLDLQPATIGEVVMVAKQQSQSNANPYRTDLDQIAEAFLGPPEFLEAERFAHMELYNLFGDPAASMHYPDTDVQIDPVVTSPVAGTTWDVSGSVPGITNGTAWVTFEVQRDVLKEPIADIHTDPANPDFVDEAVVQSNWVLANDKVIVGASVAVVDGLFSVSLSIPDPLPDSPEYYVKIYAEDGLRDAIGGFVVPMGL